jgi:hypothetical protein
MMGGSGFIGGGASYDADAETIFAAFTTPPNDTRKGVINTCVVALKNNSLWTKLDGLWMFAAADEQASLINWKNPGTSNATQVEPTTAITFNADQGYTGNGSDNYIKTNLTLNTGGLNFTEDSASYGVWSRSTAQAATSLMAANTAGGAWSALIVPRNGSDQALARNNQAAAGGEATASSVTDGSGLYHSSRVANTGHTLYRNGSSIATLSTESVAPGAVDFFVGGTNNNGALANPTTRQFSAAFVGGGMDATEASNFYNAILAYMQAVGAA